MSETKYVCIGVRNGEEVWRKEGFTPADTFIVPVVEPMVGNINDLRYSPPAYVLMDRFNPDHEHWWAEEERKRDVYVRKEVRRKPDENLVELVFEYDRTESRKVRNHYRMNPEMWPK